MSFIRSHGVRLVAALFTAVLLTMCSEEKAPDPLGLELIVTDVTVFGGYDGSVMLEVTGGVPPYGYNWSNGATTKDIENLTAGIYSVTVRDETGSVATAKDTVNQPMKLELTTVDVTEFGGSDGSISLVVQGGVAPNTFNWSNGAATKDIANLPAGIYSVTVRDAIGSVATATDTVKQPEPGNSVYDIQGNRYTVVDIGGQTWMKQNLRVTVTPDSTPVTSYVYGGNEAYAATYGRFYSWDVAMNGSRQEKAQGLCPTGWHIPSDEEWKILEMFLGMTRAEADLTNAWRGDGVGTKLGKGGESGYEALYAGRRTSDGNYSLLDWYEYVWTSTEYGSYAWRRCLDKNQTTAGRWNTFPKTYGFSVRCVKD